MSKSKQANKAQQDRIALMEMYKAGYSDASKNWNKRTQTKCFKAFKKRFMIINDKEVKQDGRS